MRVLVLGVVLLTAGALAAAEVRRVAAEQAQAVLTGLEAARAADVAELAAIESEIDRLIHEIAAFPGFELVIDLPNQVVRSVDGSLVYAFEVEAFRKDCMLNGWDDIGLVLRHADKIRDFEARRLAEQPWLGKSLGA